jgi:predicted nucleic acid-binding protein
MNVLVDTNILGRLAQPEHPQYRLAVDATDALRKRGDVPCVVPQVLFELWVVATRPTGQNGLGLTAIQAADEVSRIESLFQLLPDSATIYTEWRRLVMFHQIVGKNAHDTRLVAAMLVHNVSHILTFNARDFTRYPEISLLDPAALAPPLASGSSPT